MSRMAVTLLIVLACAAYAGAAGKAEFNVDFFCGWDGYYRPMEWTPVEIGISSDLTEPFAGTFTLSTRQDGLNTLNIARRFVLTPEVQQHFPLVTKIAFGMGQCDLAIRDKRGRMQWEYAVEMWDPSSEVRLLRPIQEQDLLIGVVGQSQFGLLRLSRDAACVSDRGGGKVWIGRKVPRAVPRDWTGFASLDVLVLYDPDWSLLHHEALEAIGAWVSNGGTLLLVLGQHPLSQSNPLAATIPFDIDEPRQDEVTPEVLRRWGLDSQAAETVTTWPLTAKSDAWLTRAVRTTDGAYLYGLGCVGFGRVAVLGFDPFQFSDAQATHAAAFWITHIRACLESDPVEESQAERRDVAVNQSGGRYGRTIVPAQDDDDAQRVNRDDNRRYRISVAQSAGNRVMEYLYELSQMKPLSIWWVVLILTTLALLLGPVDYFVLKRLDRLPYTWLTSLGWIVVFTVGAYYSVQALRGGRMQLRAISVLDGIADTDCAWATYYTGLFAPRSADYRLEGLGPQQWWSGIAPSQEQLYAYQRQSATRRIHCVQEDGANLPVSVPINIWTVQSLLGEWPLEKMPFAATVEHAGDELVVELTNLSNHSILRGFVLLEDAFVDFGQVRAESTVKVTRRKRPFNPWRTSPQRRVGTYHGPSSFHAETTWVFRYPLTLGGAGSNPFFAQGCLDRSLAMHAYLRMGAALVCVEFEKAPVPFTVRDRSYDVAHVQLARQIVFPTDPQ